MPSGSGNARNTKTPMGLCINGAKFSKYLFSPEAAISGVLWKKVFLEISQYSQENASAIVSFSIKKRLQHRCFPVNFAKFLRTSFLQSTPGRLLLFVVIKVPETHWCKVFSQRLFTFKKKKYSGKNQNNVLVENKAGYALL